MVKRWQTKCEKGQNMHTMAKTDNVRKMGRKGCKKGRKWVRDDKKMSYGWLKWSKRGKKK